MKESDLEWFPLSFSAANRVKPEKYLCIDEGYFYEPVYIKLESGEIKVAIYEWYELPYPNGYFQDAAGEEQYDPEYWAPIPIPTPH